MLPAPGTRARGQFLLAILAGLALAGAELVAPALAAETQPADISAKLIPADAAFYHVCLNNREQLDIFLKSRAFAALKEMPALKEMLKQAENAAKEKGQNLEDLKNLGQQPQVKEVIDLIKDALSQEVFIYGGPNWADCAEFLIRFSNANRFGGISASAKGQEGAQVVARLMLRILQQHLGLLKVPDTVVGFKIKNPQRAEKLIAMLETVLQQVATQQEQLNLKGRIKLTKIGDARFLTINLDGEMVPWDMVPIGQIEEKPDEFQPLVNKLKSMKYTISLGVRDGWLLLGTGESTAEIARLGGPGKHLADLPEFKLLSKAGGQKLTSVGYGSKALMSRIVKASMDFQGSFKQLQQAIPPDALTAEQRKKLGQLLQGLVKDFQGLQTEPGAIFGFSFLTGRGYESYQYNWSKNPLLDGSKPLSLIQHLGGNPLLALVIRQKASPDLFELFVKWIRTAYDFASEVAVPKLPEKEKKEFEKWSGALKPLVERLFEVTGKMLLPSLADGQKAIVLDAKWTSKQWFKDQPLSERPLPMLQLGLLLGVSDAAQFRKAIENYRAIIGEGIGKIHELSGKEGPAPKIPKPQTREEDGIQLRWWPLPEKWGLDKQVAPTAGLSENVAVLAVSQECAQRLLKETPLKGDSKLLANIGERPLVGLAYCNWPGVVNALTPWIEYGIRQKAKNETMEDQKVKAILDQVHTVSNVLKTFRGVVALMYLEDGALVEHSEAVFRDLPPLERVKAKPVKPKADNP